MTGGYNHDIPGARQVAAILIRSASGADGEAATVAVEHHRSFASVCRRRPHVEKQAIFSRHAFADAKVGAQGRLQRRRSALERIANTCPGLQGRRRLESVCARYRSRIWDAFEGRKSLRLHSANTA